MANSKEIFTLKDAQRRTGPRVFTTLVKPAGSMCNLNCRYCYYLEKAQLYGGVEPLMSPELLELYIKQYIEASEAETVEFCWHGGEPLMLGLDFYKRAMKLQRKYAGGREVHNSLQTNGTLVNEAWCRFFAENDFLVGLSIDGPEDIHDANRVNKGGRPTFDKVFQTVRLFQRCHVEFNTLSVVTRLSEQRGLEIYRFFRDVAGSRYMQFLPAADWLPDGSYAPWSITAEGYGGFLCSIFDEWISHDVGSTYVQIFDATLANWCGVEPGICTMSETCGEGLAVEHNGDVYPCDHFVLPELKLGNIRETPLKELYESEKRLKFALEKRNTLPASCLRCEWFFCCHGECPGHRLHGKNELCGGLRAFFAHSAPAMERMRELLQSNRAPAEIMWEKPIRP